MHETGKHGTAGTVLVCPLFSMGKHGPAGTEQSNVPYFQTDTQPKRDCPVFSTRKHGTAGTGQSNVPYFQTHSRNETVPCFQRENTGQLGRDNPMSRIFRHTAGTRLSRVFNEKTRDSRDGTIQCPVFSPLSFCLGWAA